LIAIPARFSATASALRYTAEVNARALIEAVWRAGGEPVGIHPSDPADTDVAARLARFDGVLLPGGGDIAPYRYGATDAHGSVYDVDDLQGAFDLEVARRALESGIPLLAICRGLQVVNVALGGVLVQDMGGPDHEHRHLRHPVTIHPGTQTAHAVGAEKAEASCYHHQQVDRPGSGLTVAATAEDGTIEALELPSARGWFTAVQWHPEDTASTDPPSRTCSTPWYVSHAPAESSRGTHRCLEVDPREWTPGFMRRVTA
jgi:putative glutamine amidotransferase